MKNKSLTKYFLRVLSLKIILAFLLNILFCNLVFAVNKVSLVGSYKAEADLVLGSFNGVFADRQVEVSELKKVTHELGVFYLKLSREKDLNDTEKSQLLKPIAKALGDSVVMITDPLANPVMSSRFYRGHIFEAAMDWVGTKFRAIIRDITQIPHLTKDARINKIGKAPIDELNALLLSEVPSFQTKEEATEVKKFFSLMVTEFERAEPYRFQTQHSFMYRLYVGTALYVALIDRPDWVGLVHWDFNTWSPVYSAVSLTIVSLAFAYNRYLNSGRGVLKSYQAFAETVEVLDSQNAQNRKSNSGLTEWIRNLPQSCSRLLGRGN